MFRRIPTSQAASASSSAKSRAREAHGGFSLVEVLVATTILGLATGMTMVVFIAALKRAQHTELMLRGTSELRYAADVISQTVRSSAQLPTVQSSGLKLLVAPKDLGVLIVDETTWIDQPHGVKGSKSNQRMVHAFVQVPLVVKSVFKSSARPSGALSIGDVGTYFVGAGNATTTKVSQVVDTGDLVSLPETGYGAAVAGLEVNNVSNNSGTATITFTTNLGVNVPQGTKISATSGRRVMFEVVGTGASAGQLRYYPDYRDLTKFTILARDIDPTPLSDPAVSTSAGTVPFVIPTTATDYVIVNLQKIPKGSTIGRTLQGVQTTAYTRSDPSTP